MARHRPSALSCGKASRMVRTTAGSVRASWKSSRTARNGAGALSTAWMAATGVRASGAIGSSPRWLDQTATLASMASAAARQAATARASSTVTT